MIDFWGKKLGHVNRAVKILADTSLFSFLKKNLDKVNSREKWALVKFQDFFSIGKELYLDYIWIGKNCIFDPKASSTSLDLIS